MDLGYIMKDLCQQFNLIYYVNNTSGQALNCWLRTKQGMHSHLIWSILQNEIFM